MRFRGSPALRRSALGLLASLSVLLTGCATLPQNPLDPKGPVAEAQTGLLMTSLWVATVIGAVVTVLLVIVVLRFRAKPGQTEVPKQIHGSTKLEILWTAIPIAILVAIAIPTVQANFATMGRIENPDMTVKVVGHQWWFEFQYPEKSVTTANELVIPVGKKVAVELVSDDVIHSFWVPQLAGKTDVIPNRLNHMWLQANEEGLYYGQCAEFCGDSHAKMRFRVRVVSDQAYTAWVETRLAQQKGLPAATDADIAAGRALFEGQTKVKNSAGKEIPKVNCASCHAIDGTTAKGKTAPNLSNVGDRNTVAAGILENYGPDGKFDAALQAANLKKWIRNPVSFKPGTVMPSHPESKLSDTELDQIVKYLQSLNK
ncbi:MAG TPA: cytochrome c oxidase subunit II [Symbiobacteriaceae bacterium]|nr:cytochrome c oxidase subunit II [Symbiobacteriaceae bacterium]